MAMNPKKLPKVFIFEGGDVCGKTTQLEKINDELCKRKDENLEVYKFKFLYVYLHCGLADLGNNS